MNYAALIALLAALAFALPFLVGLAENAGIPRGFSMMTTLAAAVFVLAWALLRARLRRRLAIEERIAHISRQRGESPDDPASFYLYGDHLGDLLLTLGREREALAAFEAYQLVAERVGHDTEAANRAVGKLRRRLGREEGANASL